MLNRWQEDQVKGVALDVDGKERKKESLIHGVILQVIHKPNLLLSNTLKLVVNLVKKLMNF